MEKNHLKMCSLSCNKNNVLTAKVYSDPEQIVTQEPTVVVFNSSFMMINDQFTSFLYTV